MDKLPLDLATYTTQPRTLSPAARIFPSLYFYTCLIREVFQAAALAKHGRYGSADWQRSSLRVLDHLESIGVHVRVSGLEHLRDPALGPCVIIGNHMSFIETMLLPGLILPKPLTFVIKQSLLEYPVFKHVMRSSNPIAVTRVNPRQDLKTVLDEGVQRLESGLSVVVFPQSTRSHHFEPASMGSIGVKLAKKAGVPVVPLALKTDALQNGKMIKDFGLLRLDLPVRFAFDAPLSVEGKGAEEMQQINDFIQAQLRKWQVESEGTANG